LAFSGVIQRSFACFFLLSYRISTEVASGA
jgi:hypothetical protein